MKKRCEHSENLTCREAKCPNAPPTLAELPEAERQEDRQRACAAAGCLGCQVRGLLKL